MTAEPTPVEIVDDAEPTPADAPVPATLETAVAAIERHPAREMPTAIAGLPSISEVHTMELVARQICSTEMVPRSYRGKPDAILAAFLAGRELRVPPMQALRDINIVEGQPAPSAKLMRELILRAGHSIRRVSAMDATDVAILRYRRKDWPAGEWSEATFSIEQAVAAGLCKIVDGKVQARSSKGNALPWEQYTAAMLRHRCLSSFAREDFADCLGSMIYTAEELGAMVDEDGRVVDVGPAGDERSPEHVRWDLAIETLEQLDAQDAIDWLREKFVKETDVSAFAFLDLGSQAAWADLAETVVGRIRKRRRMEATGGIDPEAPHAFQRSDLGDCQVCGGDETHDLHRDGDVAASPPDAPSSPPAAGVDGTPPPSASAPGPGERAPANAEGPQPHRPGPDEPPLGDEMPAPSAVRHFHALRREVGWPDDVYRQWLRDRWSVSSSKDLGARDLADAIDELDGVIKRGTETPDASPGEQSAGTPARSETSAHAETPAPAIEAQASSQRKAAGQSDGRPGQDVARMTEEQIRDDLEARYTEAYGRVVGTARQGRLDAKRALALQTDEAWRTAELGVLKDLVAHAEKAATELDPSRPLPSADLPY